MIEDSKFWLGVWMTLASVMIVLIASIAIYNMHKNATIAAVLKTGVDPVEVRCAFDVGAFNAALCNRLR